VAIEPRREEAHGLRWKPIHSRSQSSALASGLHQRRRRLPDSSEAIGRIRDEVGERRQNSPRPE
jgi:hypothetical protein